METTEPLRSGTKLPDHPDSTTARKVISYGAVKDAHDGQLLTAGLHENEIRTLMGGAHALGHLYRYAIRNGFIFHTRPRVVIEVVTEPVDDTIPS